jgi:hypothetical protein
MGRKTLCCYIEQTIVIAEAIMYFKFLILKTKMLIAFFGSSHVHHIYMVVSPAN